jgi:hypothetical protein
VAGAPSRAKSSGRPIPVAADAHSGLLQIKPQLAADQ